MRCEYCGRKTLLLYDCKCDKKLCFNCRDHECDFDYKSEGKKKLEKENPKVVAEKITKI
jgi:hypothetical protein